MSKPEMKDKNAKKNKVLIGVFAAIIVLFILIRVVALNATSEGGITVVRPDLDSVNLNNNTSKMDKFEKEHNEELEKENGYNISSNPEPASYNFKQMYAVDDKSTEPKKEVVTDNKTVESKGGYGKYSPVNSNSNEVTVEQVRKVRAISNKVTSPEVEEKIKVEEEPVNSNPFGTFSSNKNKSVASSGGKIKDAYKCFLHSDQKIANGGGVIFRAGEDIILADRIIKKNSILYGTSTYQGQRVMIKINRVKAPDGEYSVNLIVYDNDFVKGIFFKNAYDEVAEKTTDDVANDGSQITVNNGIIGTATKAVVHAGKNVGDAIKKERALKLQEGYIIYIKEFKQNDGN